MRQLLPFLLLFTTISVFSQAISFGDLISGEISSPGEIDSYTFSANAGDVIYLAAKGFGVAPRAEVFEPGGDEIGEVSSGASYESGRIVIEVTGTHTLTFEDTFGDQTGTYNIGFERINPATNAEPKQFGDLITGEITSSAQVDLFTFSANAGEAIYLAVKGIDGVAPRARVYDAVGDFVGSVSTGASYESGRIYIERSGTHTLVFEETFLENTGDYYIGLEKIATAVNATSQNFGDLISGELTTPAQVDLYTFSANAGEAIYIAVKGFDTAPRARVYDSDGDFVGSVSTGASYESGRIYIEKSGIHTLVFEETFLENIGDYYIGLEKIAAAENATSQDFGDLISGELTSPAQVDLYTFSAVAGDEIYLTVKGFDTAPRARVYDSDGDFVGSVSSGASYESGSISIEKTGTHTLVYEETFLENLGDYYIGLEKIASAENAISKNFGDLISGELVSPAQVDLYTFSAVEGDVIYLAAKGIDTAPSARVYDSDGDFVGSVSSGASYESGSIDIEKTGTHTLVFEETFLENVGAYNIALERIFPVVKAELIGLNSVFGRPLDNATQVDLYTFSASTGDVIHLSASGYEGVSPTAKIYDPFGDFLGSASSGASSATRTLELEETGNYIISFEDTFLEDVGDYCLGLSLICNGTNCDETAPIESKFGACQTQIAPGDVVNFINISTNESSQTWSFEGGDPETSTSDNPTITYDQSGSYDVTLTVSSGADSDDETKNDYIIVSGADPVVAAFTTENTTVQQGSTIQFFDNSSGDVISWDWEFENGSPSTSTDENPIVTYNSIGVFSVSLTVSNGSITDSKTIAGYVNVVEPEEPPLIAGFTVNTDSISRGQSVQFTDNSSGDVIAWNWTFEGGIPATSNEQNPFVTYENEGFYDVTLVVEDAEESNTLFEENFIEVSKGPLADIVINDIQVDPSSVFYGDNIEVSTTIENIGEADAIGEIILNYYLSSDISLDNDDLKLSERSIQDVELGESITLEEVVTIPENTDVGSYFIYVDLDVTNVIEESDEENNFRFIFMQVLSRAPFLANTIGDLDLEEGFVSETIDISEVFGDPDEDMLTFNVVSNDTDVVTAAISNMELILTEQGPGITIVELTADDNEDGTVSTSFEVSVNASGNNKPIVVNEIDDLSFSQGFVSEVIDISGVFDDQDGDALTITIQGVQGNSVEVSISGTSLTLTEIENGITTISLRANDGKGGIVETLFDVEVKGNNDPVVENAIADLALTEGFVTFELDIAGVFSDQDGDQLTYIASSDNTSVLTVDVSGTTLTISEVGSGSANVSVTADDGNGGIATDEFGVIISDNNIPIVVNAINDLSLEVDFVSEVISLSDVFSDADGDELTYTASSDNTTLVTVSISGTNLVLVEGTPPGQATITVTAEDGKGGSAMDEFVVTIGDVNMDPVVENPIQDLTFSQGFVSEVIDLNEVFVDPDEDELVFSAVSTDEDVVIVQISGSSIVIIEQGIGSANVSVTAEDQNGGSVMDEFIITIDADSNNDPIVSNEIEDQTLQVGFILNVIDLSSVFIDPDGDILQFTVESSNAQVVSASIAEDELFLVEKGVGVSTIVINANDGNGGETSDEFLVEVTDEGVLGIEDIREFLYPTITKDFINVNVAEAVDFVSIIDLNGASLKKFQGTKRLDVRELENDIYLLSVRLVNGKTLSSRFIKE